MSVDVTKNSDLLIQQYKNAKKLKAIIDGINEIIQDYLVNPALELRRQRSIITASGVWLDYLGKKYGISRPYLSSEDYQYFGFDDNGVGFDQSPFSPDGSSAKVPAADDFYRKLIMARGSQIITDGTLTSMNGVLEAAFDGGHYIDHTDMSMTVRIDGDYRQDQVDMIINTNLITKPCGVRINELLIVHEDGAFGFDDNGVGFDQAPYATYYSLEG